MEREKTEECTRIAPKGFEPSLVGYSGANLVGLKGEKAAAGTEGRVAKRLFVVDKSGG